MRNIRLTIEYDGKCYNGWQKQPDKLNIQGEIERAIFNITKEEVDLIGSGRTDAGVHALGQIANFKTNSNMPIEKMAIAINSQLKNSIIIKKAEEVDERFHSRYNAKQKTYRYVINNNQCESAIYRNFEYHMPVKLDIKAMQKAVEEMGTAQGFKGYGPEQGYEFLREEISKKDYKARNIDISVNEIFVSDGSKCDCGNIVDIFAKPISVESSVHSAPTELAIKTLLPRPSIKIATPS